MDVVTSPGSTGAAHGAPRPTLTSVTANVAPDRMVELTDALRAGDLARPGHMFPLRAQAGGVLKRAGQTEASVDLARIAGLQPAAVICEVMNDDGTMARTPDLIRFAQFHGLKIATIADGVYDGSFNEWSADPARPIAYGAAA